MNARKRSRDLPKHGWDGQGHRSLTRLVFAHPRRYVVSLIRNAWKSRHNQIWSEGEHDERRELQIEVGDRQVAQAVSEVA